MDRKDCKKYLMMLFVCIVLPLLVLCSSWLMGELGELRKTDDYVKTDCQVTNSSFGKCGITRSWKGDRQCFRLNWQIQYLQYQTDQQTTITRTDYYLKNQIHKENELRKEFRKYQVYSCYYMMNTDASLLSICCVYRLVKSIHVIILPPIV